MNRLREELVKAGGVGVTATALGPTAFQLAGVAAEQDGVLRQAATEVEATYNRESGAAGTYAFRMKANIANQIRQETVDQAIRTIERRVNELGVAEPIVARQGGQDQILVAAAGRERRRPRQGDHQVDVAARVDAGRSGTGQHARAIADGYRRQRAVRRRGAAGRGAVAAPGQAPGGRGLLPGQEDPGGQRARPAQCAADP